MSIISNKQCWEKEQIGTHCIVGDGAHARIKRQNSGVKYLTSKNFKNGRLDLSKLDYISEESYQKYFKEDSKALTKPQPNDVLFSIIGTIGEPYIVQNGDKYGLSSSVSIIRPNKLQICPQYLYYWIKGHIFQDALYGIKGGVAQSYVSLEMIRSLPLYYPSLYTQNKIASILSAYDDLIENNTRRIKILESMAQTLYQEWFVKFRFPGHEQVQMVESDLGLIPEGWEVQKLGKISDINKKNINKKNAPEQINYINITSVSPGRINEIETMDFDDAPSRARRLVKHGDIIWSTVRPNRKSYSLILNPIKNLVASTGFAVISAKKTAYSYLYHVLTTDDFVHYLANNATGSAYPAVNTNDFKNADILFPASEIVDKFNSIVEDMLFQKENLQQKNINLRKTRDLLLPKLISGQIDVENLDIDTGEIAA